MPKETRSDETRIYICRVCDKAIMTRLPKGLKGVFAHARCWREEADKILDAEVIS